MERTFLFKVELQGSGENEEEAWTDAIEDFTADPGEPHEIEEVIEEES